MAGLAGLTMCATGGILGLGPAARAAGTVPAFDHIFTIVIENHSYNEIIGNRSAPYINSLANQYGLATNYFAITHPSLPNYLAPTGGSTFGITTDCTASSTLPTSPSTGWRRRGGAGRPTWNRCPASSGTHRPYAQKHNSFIYYDDIRLNATECDKVVPYTSFAGDLASASTTPNYAWVTPNLCNDMHDCSIATGETWLSQNVPTILNSPAWTTQNSLLLITWDEDDGTQNNQVPMLVISKNVTPGFRSWIHYDHYSMLKTIEASWGLSSLTTNDANAVPMSDFFGSNPATLQGPRPASRRQGGAGARGRSPGRLRATVAARSRATR